MRCDACKRPATMTCKCGAKFCEEVTVSEHEDLRTRQTVRIQYKCVDLHHCGRGMAEALSRLADAHRKMSRQG